MRKGLTRGHARYLALTPPCMKYAPGASVVPANMLPHITVVAPERGRAPPAELLRWRFGGARHHMNNATSATIWTTRGRLRAVLLCGGQSKAQRERARRAAAAEQSRDRIGSGRSAAAHAPSASALTMWPLFWMPPSAMVGTPICDASCATLYTAVACRPQGGQRRPAVFKLPACRTRSVAPINQIERSARGA